MVPTMALLFVLLGFALMMLGPVLDGVTAVRRPPRRRRRRRSARTTSTATEPTPFTVVPKDRDRGL